ncbi:cytosolic carboxypeptidase 2-like isoform X2 [Rhopilema esculentum]
MNQRWPAEVPLVAKKPSHIYFAPSRPETLYKPVKDSKPLLKTSHILGKVVYDNSPDLNIKYFTRSKCSGRTIHAKPHYRLQGPDDNTLLFESRFESGNLMRAIKVGDYDYELWLRFDLYTNKHTQWYYFMVQNAKPGVQYRFTIMNFVKAGSLYSDGMRPLGYSEIDAENKGIGWVRTGTNIRYYRNDIKFFDGIKERNYYSLTWSCSFQNESDTYYFAHCYPYTYSDLQDYLALLASDPARSRCCKQRILCRTLAGNLVYVLTITAPSKKKNEAEVKKAIVITARVHPGETNSSWMMKGFIDYLTSNAQDAKVLRENFIFKIVPMLNPDGVVVGNYRCSLAGRDLNRNYKTVLKDSFPSIWHTRAMIKKLQEEREILMYCDLHGHSRKKNIFIYGCENRREKNRRFFSRVFPAMLAKNASDKFSQNYCRFKVQKNREGTGRIFMWNFGIANSFTMEASFCGSSLGKRKGHHFSVADYESMAYEFCDTLLDYCDPDQTKFYYILSEIEGCIRKAILDKLNTDDVIDDDDVDIESNLDLLSEIESDSGGSDSSVSDGLPMQLLHASVPELSRKKRLKTRKERNKNFTKNTKIEKSFNENLEMQNSKTSNNPKNDKKETETRTVNSPKGRMSYTKRGSSATGRVVPHYVKDRVVEKTKLKKDYLEMLTTSFVSTGADELIDLQDIPHCRFTAGLSTIYQGQKSCATCERCCRSLSEGSDEERSILNVRARPSDQLSDVYRQLYGTGHNANTVLDLARRITVYNHRLSQSVSRRRRSKTLSPNQLRSLWQRKMNNQYEDLELSVTSSESKVSPEMTKWNRNAKASSPGRRHFEIRQEKRSNVNGLYSHSRIEKHFEIKKTSSYPGNGLKISQKDLKSNSSEYATNLVGDGVTGQLATRRLPHLKKFEVEDSATDGSRTNSVDNMFTFGEALRQPAQPEPVREQLSLQSRDATRNYLRNDNGSVRKAAEKLSSQNEHCEVAMLKEKMLLCGATGLVSYVLDDDETKRKDLIEKALSSATKTNHFLTMRTNINDENLQISPDDRKSPKGTLETLNQTEGRFTLLETEKRTPKMSSTKLAVSEDTSPLLQRGNSDIQIASNKVRKLLNKQETLIGKEPCSPGLMRSKTSEDVSRQGLVSLNVNLNIMPIGSSNVDTAKTNQKQENVLSNCRINCHDSSTENFATRMEQTITWLPEETSSLSITEGIKNACAKPLLLEYSGKNLASTPFSNRTKTCKLNPPQLGGLGRMSRDSTL